MRLKRLSLGGTQPFSLATMNYKNLNYEIETEEVTEVTLIHPASMNYKNLNYEIETGSQKHREHQHICAMNYKNLNYEIETYSVSVLGERCSMTL